MLFNDVQPLNTLCRFVAFWQNPLGRLSDVSFEQFMKHWYAIVAAWPNLAGKTRDDSLPHDAKH